MHIVTRITLSFSLAVLCIVSASAQTDIPTGYSLDQVAELHAPAHTMVKSGSMRAKPEVPQFLDWVPQSVVWNDHLLKATAHQCAEWIEKFDSRYRIDHDSVHQFTECQVQLFDSIGSLRWVMNSNPALKAKSKRDQLRVYVVMSYGSNRRWGFYTYDELSKAVKAIR